MNGNSTRYVTTKVNRPDGGVDLVIRLTAEEAAMVGGDGLNMVNLLANALLGLANIRSGAWGVRLAEVTAAERYPGLTRAQQQDVLYDLEQHLIPQLEAIGNLALRGMRAGGAGYGEIAKSMGVPRATAQSRWRAMQKRRHPLESWALHGTSTALLRPHGPQCDHRVVGVDIVNEAGDRLLFERATLPYGVAPPAGHIDGHGTPEDAARAETSEEVGLTVLSLRPVTGGWMPNRCGRWLPIGDSPGHDWSIYAAEVTGTLTTDTEEVQNARWRTPAEIQALAERTVAHARGEVTELDFQRQPGLEPVWVRWYAQMGVITLPEDDVTAAFELAL